jgi:hypothetical protein
MPTQTSRWTLLRSVNGGHRFFQCTQTLKIALADSSGSTPDKTEDGILWLDSTRPLEVGVHTLGPVVFCPLVKHRTGKESFTYVTVQEALWLAKQFNLKVTSKLSDLRDLLALVE